MVMFTEWNNDIMTKHDEEEQGAVQGCTPKDPGVKVI